VKIILIIAFLNVKKSNPKKPHVSRFVLRVAVPAGARGNSLALKQVRALYPSAPSMLGAGQKGQNP
jgi:hypothetical protein